LTFSSIGELTVTSSKYGGVSIHRYVGEGARMVRELFQLARSKKAAIVFFDEVDAIGGNQQLSSLFFSSSFSSFPSAHTDFD
jgi:AAA+ superfamily predicted ATPase